jgi:Domain of unknown function (DUF6431)
VLIVENDPAKVEVDLVEGRAACPACGGVLARWSFARRRFVRTESGPTELRPRRARCRGCAKTQVLLPDVLLCRRVDTVAVVGRALTAAAGGASCRRAAVLVSRPLTTVRGWLRRARAVAAQLAVHFTVWAHRLDANLGPIAPCGSALADALAAIGAAARAASLRLGPRPAWSWASALSGGMLISNTSSPWKGA